MNVQVILLQSHLNSSRCIEPSESCSSSVLEIIKFDNGIAIGNCNYYRCNLFVFPYSNNVDCTFKTISLPTDLALFLSMGSSFRKRINTILLPSIFTSHVISPQQTSYSLHDFIKLFLL